MAVASQWTRRKRRIEEDTTTSPTPDTQTPTGDTRRDVTDRGPGGFMTLDRMFEGQEPGGGPGGPGEGPGGMAGDPTSAGMLSPVTGQADANTLSLMQSLLGSVTGLAGIPGVGTLAGQGVKAANQFAPPQTMNMAFARPGVTPGELNTGAIGFTPGKNPGELNPVFSDVPTKPAIQHGMEAVIGAAADAGKGGLFGVLAGIVMSGLRALGMAGMESAGIIGPPSQPPGIQTPGRLSAASAGFEEFAPQMMSPEQAARAAASAGRGNFGQMAEAAGMTPAQAAGLGAGSIGMNPAMAESLGINPNDPALPGVNTMGGLADIALADPTNNAGFLEGLAAGNFGQQADTPTTNFSQAPTAEQVGKAAQTINDLTSPGQATNAAAAAAAAAQAAATQEGTNPEAPGPTSGTGMGPVGPGGEGQAGPTAEGPGGVLHHGGLVRLGNAYQGGLVPGGDEDRDGLRNVPIMAEEGERVIPAERAGFAGMAGADMTKKIKKLVIEFR